MAATGNNPVLHIKAADMLYESNPGSRRLYFRYMRDLLEGGYINGYRKGIRGAIVEMKFLHDPAEVHIVSLPRTKSPEQDDGDVEAGF